MPAGYSYHRAEFKSPPGPPASDIGYKYNADKNAQVQEEWRYALRDLMIRSMADGVAIPDQVALVTDLKGSAFQGQYDSLLREGLRAYGHTLVTDIKTTGPKLFYSAYGKDTLAQLKRGGLPAYNDQTLPPQDSKFTPRRQPMLLVLGIIENGQFVSKTSAAYELPIYGFDEGIFAYLPGHERPIPSSAYQGLQP